jgi:hypothetical protein
VPPLQLAGRGAEEGSLSSPASLAPSSSVTLPTTGSSTYRASTASTPGPEDLQQAVSGLALAQQACLQEMLARQEQERRQLRQEFELRQRELVQQILHQFPGLHLGTAEPGKENTPPVARPQASPGTKPPMVRNLESSFNSMASSTPSSSGTLKKEESARPVLRSNTFKVQPAAVEVPAAALEPLHRAAWVRLTALGRGFLVRRLLATDRVRHLRRTVRETLACAVQLHREATGAAPGRQELELHARLLAQLEAACAQLHHIFFGLDTPGRMALLAADRTARRARADRSEDGGAKPRLSAATAARLATRSKLDSGGLASSNMARFETRRRRAVLTSRSVSASGPSAREPRSRVVRSICSSGGPAVGMTQSVGGAGGSRRPSWK